VTTKRVMIRAASILVLRCAEGRSNARIAVPGVDLDH
jgi:hypothetical protein